MHSPLIIDYIHIFSCCEAIPYNIIKGAFACIVMFLSTTGACVHV